MINELIEQIGGRERLEFIAEDCAEARFSEIEAMARALLAVLDAKPVGTVSIMQDLYAIPRRNIATVNMRPDLVLSEMRDGDNLYTVPPAASAPDGWKLVPVNPTQEMLNAAWEKHAIYHPSAYRTMLAAAPAPGEK